MLIVAFEGGLGNQMFQYAFFKALQMRYPDIYVLADLSYINNQVHNGFELEKVFGIQMETCTLEDAAKYSERCPEGIIGWRIFNFLYRIRRYVFGQKKSYIKQENASVYYPGVFQLNPLYNFYFKGVWANESYFQDLRDKLLEDFVFCGDLSKENKMLSDMIESTNSVSIHLRVGDYRMYNYEICDSQYYSTAIEYIRQRVIEPDFFVFSDDIPMAKEIIGDWRDIHFVNNNTGKHSFRDMQLMSLCKHNIIANSTFSFWGAYLNTNQNKIVIAPTRRVGDCIYPYRCEEWVLL